MQSSIVGQMSERSLEQARAQYLTRAHEALSSGRYVEALRLLESCQKEGISSPEIAELMDFARQEADQPLNNNQLQGLLKQAQELMTRESYRAVVELLTPVSRRTGGGFPSLSPGRCSQPSAIAPARASTPRCKRSKLLSTPGTLCRGGQISGIAAAVGSSTPRRFRPR